MVGVFRRCLSFPNKHSNRPSKPPIFHHIRSISLPCRSRPLISQVKNEISDLKTRSTKPENRTSAWLCDGLSHLKDVHDSLDDFLHLPRTQDSLRNQHVWVEKLLEDFLRFVDVYRIFQTSVIMAVKEEQFAAQVAIRKKDDKKIAFCLIARKRLAKEIVKLVIAVQWIGQYSVPRSMVGSIVEADLAGVVSDAVEVTMLVTVALFNGILTAFVKRKSSLWMGLLGLRKKAKKLKVEEEGIREFQQQQVGVESLLWGLRKKGDDEQVWMVLNKMQNLEG